MEWITPPEIECLQKISLSGNHATAKSLNRSIN